MTDNPILEPDQFYGKAEPELEVEQSEEVELEAQQAEQDAEDVETPVETEESDEQGDDEELLVIELDGEEISLREVKKWRDGHMQQADYTKKTQALAEERKTFEAERESERSSLAEAQKQIASMKDLLEVLVNEDAQTDWDALWDSDPDEWKVQKEKAEKREKALQDLRANRNQEDPEVIRAEQVKLVKANPEWLDKDGKLTDAYRADTKLLNEYAVKAGFTPEEFSQMTKAHYLQAILKAAKYDQLKEKGREIKSKREKVPVVTKPKKPVSRTKERTADQILYG